MGPAELVPAPLKNSEKTMLKGFIKGKIKGAIKEIIEELLDLAKDAQPYVGKDGEGKTVYGIKIKKEF